MQEREEEGLDKVQINFQLSGRDAANFLRIKRARFINANAEFARMLILERLSEIGEKPAEVA